MNQIFGFAIIAFVGWVIYSSLTTQPGSSIAGKDVIKYDATSMHWNWKKDTDGTGTLFLRDKSTNDVLGVFVTDSRGVLYEDPSQANDPKFPFKVSYKPDTYLGEYAWDFGAIAGMSLADQKLEVGLRASPVRVFFGTLSPDLVLTNDRFGLGASVYAPRDYFPEPLDCFGLGCWYTLPYGGNSSLQPGLVAGLSVQARF